MSRSPGLLDYVCANADKFAILLALEVLAGVVSLLIFIFSAPGSAARVVSALNIFGVTVIGGFTAVLLWICHRR